MYGANTTSFFFELPVLVFLSLIFIYKVFLPLGAKN
jgi:hypothetical protein